ncbi:hypothetical protein STENM327S_05266 [Streptomyces tendae]
MGGEVAVGDGGADAQAAVRGLLDAVQGEFSDVDEPGGALDAGLHQVDEVGAAGEEAGVRVGGEQGDGAGDVFGALVSEFPHAAVSSVVSRRSARSSSWAAASWASAARVTAWTMET